jgi:hypothetical protein
LLDAWWYVAEWHAVSRDDPDVVVDLPLAALEAVLVTQRPKSRWESQMNTEQNTASDDEAFRRLLVDLRYLARFDDMSCNERLRALDEAIERAITGPPEQASNFVRDVMDGRVKP